ncbi:MAG: NfeD family protein [Oscillospiraceae bacterium]|nr:NfeD family protein [Oscillospiraceae bacterium]
MDMVLWIVVLIVATIAEAVTTALVSIWFCVGAVAAAVAAGLGVPVFFQLLIFVGVSALTLLITRPLVGKMLPKGDHAATNGEDDVGKHAIVVEDINERSGTGRVKLGDVDWAAVSENGSVLSKGSMVEIVSKGAAVLTVRPIDR